MARYSPEARQNLEVRTYPKRNPNALYVRIEQTKSDVSDKRIARLCHCSRTASFGRLSGNHSLGRDEACGVNPVWCEARTERVVGDTEWHRWQCFFRCLRVRESERVCWTLYQIIFFYDNTNYCCNTDWLHCSQLKEILWRYWYDTERTVIFHSVFHRHIYIFLNVSEGVWQVAMGLDSLLVITTDNSCRSLDYLWIKYEYRIDVFFQVEWVVNTTIIFWFCQAGILRIWPWPSCRRNKPQSRTVLHYCRRLTCSILVLKSLVQSSILKRLEKVGEEMFWWIAWGGRAYWYAFWFQPGQTPAIFTISSIKNQVLKFVSFAVVSSSAIQRTRHRFLLCL